jgi:nucleotide-binding universal stress UspA family protein
MRITRILIPTDFSEASDTALAEARDLAATLGAQLRIVHVFDDPFVASAMSADGQMVISPDLRASLMRDADARLRQRLATGATRNRGEEAALLTGPIAVSIVEDAQSHAVDLILMATHGRGGMAHLLLGSVAERVVRTAPCPVMTVRPHLPAARATGAAASAGASHV